MHPWWRRDGREIVYQDLGGWVVAVDVEARADAFLVGAHASLFEARLPDLPAMSVNLSYAPMPDAQRFLLVQLEEEDIGPLTLVVNWTAELEQ